MENNILDTIKGWFNGKGAERAYFKHRTERIGAKGAVYIETDVPYKLVNEIPQLKLAIGKLESMFSNMSLKYQKIGEAGFLPMPGELQALLENPNPLQSQNEFLKQYISQLVVYGNQFIYKNKPSQLSKLPASLINVSATNMKPILTGKVFDQIKLSDIIKEYQYQENGNNKPFKVEDVIWSKIGDLDNPLIGCSPIRSLKYPLTNTRYAYDYLNVISNERGGLGMISTVNKDSMGETPMTPEMRKTIESQFQDSYGIGESENGSKKMRIHVVEGNTTYTPMSYPTKDLLLLEQIETNFITILNVLGLSPNLFVNSTYENLKHGIIQTYSDTILPYADGFTQSLTRALGIDPAFRLVADYSHVSALQKDKVQEATTLKTVSEGLNQLVTAGIITTQQATDIIENQFGLNTGV